MKRHLACFAILLFFLLGHGSISHGQGARFTEGYRNARWGMTPEQVKQAFPDEHFEEEPDLIYFSTDLAGEDVVVAFLFFNNQLYKTIVTVQVDPANKDNYVRQFNKFENLLIAEYGQPDKMIRRGSRDRKMKDIFAIAQGRGGYLDNWKTAETTISLALFSYQSKPNLSIHYDCRTLLREKRRADKGKS